MKEIINRIVNHWEVNGGIWHRNTNPMDEIDVRDSIYWTMSAMNDIKLKWNKEFIEEFFDETCYVDFEHDFEEVVVFEINDDYIRLFAFDDGYEGYELVLVNYDGKIGIKSVRDIGYDECNAYGMSDEDLNGFIIE